MNWYAEGFVELADEERSELKGRTLEKYLDARRRTPLDAGRCHEGNTVRGGPWRSTKPQLRRRNNRAARAEIQRTRRLSDTPVDGNHGVCVRGRDAAGVEVGRIIDKLRASVVVDMETRAAEQGRSKYKR